MEIGITTVNNHIAGRHVGQQLFNHLIDRSACLNHHHDDTRTLNGFHQFLDRMGRDKILPLATAVHKTVHHPFLTGETTVIYSNGKTFAFHVQSQILTHNGETYQSDICFFHVLFYFIFRYFINANKSFNDSLIEGCV